MWDRGRECLNGVERWCSRGLRAQAVRDGGARSVSAIATHAVLSGPAVERIVGSTLESVVVTDTIPLTNEAADSGKLHVVSVAPLFAEAIRAIHHHDSVSRLFG